MVISFQARVVFPVDAPPIEHGVVTIDGDRIVAVGTADTAVGQVRDLGNVALLPGLVNAHTHLEFGYLPKPFGQPGMPLVDWLRLAIAERQRRSVSPADAIEVGLRESAACGVAILGEIATADAPAYASDARTDLTVFLEVIGFSRARSASALGATVERLNGWLWSTAGNPQKMQLGLSPHAPYTVSPDLLRQLVALANERHLPVAMHLAESEEELHFLANGGGPLQELLEERSMWDPTVIPHGTRPLDYLKLLAEAPRTLVIHGNYLDEEERAFLANYSNRLSLIYCPRTHSYFGHQPYPLAELLEAGVRVALGTDSRASNPDLTLLAEMRHVARTHPHIDPHTILRMGTLAGAEALGCADELGSLTPGKRASLVAFPLPDDASGSPGDRFEALLAESHLPCEVWIAGQSIGNADILTSVR